MPRQQYTAIELEKAAGVPAHTIRHWIRRKLMTEPSGRGRLTRYSEKHLLEAKAIQALRNQRLSLLKIKARLAALSDEQLANLAAPVNGQAPSVLGPPPQPNYASETWQIVQLADGLSLLVHPKCGPIVQRIANEICEYYGRKG